jgi:phage terminase large subunit-like protein
MRILINDYGWDENQIIKVPQWMRVMGPITQEVERWIVRGEIHHPNNALLNWQFQHVELEYDKAGNYKPIKPHKDDYRKIDGIISILIAAVALTSDPTVWTRDSGGILLYERQAPENVGQSASVDLSKSHVASGRLYE